MDGSYRQLVTLVADKQQLFSLEPYKERSYITLPTRSYIMLPTRSSSAYLSAY